MGLLDWFRGLFKDKEITLDEVKQAIETNPVKEVEAKVSEEIEIEEEEPRGDNEEVETPEILSIEDQDLDTTLERSESLTTLNAAVVDKKDLGLDKIFSEAETISSYCKALIKDLGNYQDLKNDKDKIESVIKAIGGKIKVINNHGLELKNLLATLEDRYYQPSIKALTKVNEKLKKDGVELIINDLKKDLELVKKLDTELTKVIGYNDLFNPDKNVEYKLEIEKETMKRMVHGDLNQLLDVLLNTVIDRSLGIKAKIERSNPIDVVKSWV